MKPEILEKLNDYPTQVQHALFELRKLIYEIAESHNLGMIQETLKWNEPSYISKYGSTIRIDWKQNTPEKYYIFFNCNTNLVETFKLLYSDAIDFQGNRAIVLDINNSLNKKIISKCILMALTYHKIKCLPFLGETNT